MEITGELYTLLDRVDHSLEIRLMHFGHVPVWAQRSSRWHRIWAQVLAEAWKSKEKLLGMLSINAHYDLSIWYSSLLIGMITKVQAI